MKGPLGEFYVGCLLPLQDPQYCIHPSVPTRYLTMTRVFGLLTLGRPW